MNNNTISFPVNTLILKSHLTKLIYLDIGQLILKSSV
jgi:hypothetical protein